MSDQLYSFQVYIYYYDLRGELLGTHHALVTDLYPGMESSEIKTDLEAGATGAKAFRERYQGTLAALDGAALGNGCA